MTSEVLSAPNLSMFSFGIWIIALADMAKTYRAVKSIRSNQHLKFGCLIWFASDNTHKPAWRLPRLLKTWLCCLVASSFPRPFDVQALNPWLLTVLLSNAFLLVFWVSCTKSSEFFSFTVIFSPCSWMVFCKVKSRYPDVVFLSQIVQLVWSNGSIS